MGLYWKCEAEPDGAAAPRRGRGTGRELSFIPTGPIGLSGPWFRAHPRAAAAVIAASSAAVLGLQLVDTRASDAIALLYVLPISLAAVTFGFAGGLSAAAVAYMAFGLFAVLSAADRVGIDGWIGRAVAMFLLGGLLGRASDQTEQATCLALAHQRRRLLVEEQNRRYGEAIELSDSILQHVTAAKWAVEQGDQVRAAALMAEALSSGQEMVGELLPPRSAWRRPCEEAYRPVREEETRSPAAPAAS